jgi:hypothetical protein
MSIWKKFFTSNLRIQSSFLYIFSWFFYFLNLWTVIQRILNSGRLESTKFHQNIPNLFTLTAAKSVFSIQVVVTTPPCDSRGWPDSKDSETLITHRKYNKVSGMQCEGWNALGGHLEQAMQKHVVFCESGDAKMLSPI